MRTRKKPAGMVNTSPASSAPLRPGRAAARSRSSPVPDSSIADLTYLAGRIPAELLRQLAEAVQSGHWLFAVWNVSAGRIQLERTATNFPTADLDLAVTMLNDNLQTLKSSRG